MLLTLSWRSKSMDWFLYDNGLRHERVNKLNPNSYPTVFEALKIIAVLPSTSCSCERSISSLRRLKNYKQSTMKPDKLNGLASTYIHRDIYINPSFVLKKFVLANPNRRANFGIADWFRKVWNISAIFILLSLVFWYWCRCIFCSNMSLFYVLSIQKRNVLQAAVCFHFM